MIDKQTLEKALQESLQKMQRKEQKSELHAAPLARVVSKKLSALIGSDKATEISSKLGLSNFKLVSAIFGEALYPGRDFRDLGFRDFLKAFPDLVELREKFDGDIVIPKPQDSTTIEELKDRYLALLIETIREQVERTGLVQIPISLAGLWLKKKDPNFDVSDIQFHSLSEWIRSVPDVTLHEDGTVSLAISASDNTGGQKQQKPKRERAYIIIDSTDVIAQLYSVIGNRSAEGNLPDWGKLVEAMKKRYPKFDWAARYFLSQTLDEAEAMSGFVHYLRNVGIEPHAFEFSAAGKSFDATLEARRAITRDIVARTIAFHALLNQAAIIVVVSHDEGLAGALLTLQKASTTHDRVVVVGFTERMPAELLELQQHGVKLLDLETDIGAFKKPLNRRHSVLKNAADYCPTTTL